MTNTCTLDKLFFYVCLSRTRLTRDKCTQYFLRQLCAIILILIVVITISISGHLTLDGPLEEGLASLAGGDPIVEPRGHVAANETTPLRLFLFILDHLAKTITMMIVSNEHVEKDDLDLWEAALCGGRA